MRSMASLAQDEGILVLDAGERKNSITTARALNVFGKTIYFKEIKEQDKEKRKLMMEALELMRHEMKMD
eukprot:5607396-Ditylum_brightwellii.AAC.1